MRKSILPWVYLLVAGLPLILPAQTVWAGDWGCLNITKWFQGTKLDEHCPKSCKQCGHEACVERAPCNDCVKGEKRVYKTSIHCQSMAVPEVKYQWRWMWVEKDVPADYCKTECEPKKVEHVHQVEHWDKTDLGGGCELHCKTCQPQVEKLTCQTCKSEPGKTTIRVHYWSYVMVPYTVYRQVKQEVCVKQPRCEKADVPVTRYVAESCCGPGCKGCKHCQHRNDP